MCLPALSKVGAGGGSEWFDSGFNDVLPRGGIPDHHLFLSLPTFWVLFSCLIIANRGFWMGVSCGGGLLYHTALLSL